MTLGDLAMENGFFSHLRWRCKFSWKTNLGHESNYIVNAKVFEKSWTFKILPKSTKNSTLNLKVSTPKT
jgi:hypothetical protein